MRDIEFRGKRVNNDEWVYGYLVVADGKYYILPDVADLSYGDNGNRIRIGCFVEVDPNTVGQYTGLKDKNGVKIYENDIVTMPSYNSGRHKAVVYFDGGKFAVDGSHYHFKDIHPRNMEVVGNIYDENE